MAKKRSRRRRDSEKAQHFSNPRLLSPVRTVVSRPHVTATPLREIEDRRSYHPLDFFRPARQLSGHPAKPHVQKTNKAAPQVMRSLRFAVPEQTAICVRRNQRKEVLFAKKKTRRGSGSKKHFNWFSKISCKR